MGGKSTPAPTPAPTTPVAYDPTTFSGRPNPNKKVGTTVTTAPESKGDPANPAYSNSLLGS